MNAELQAHKMGGTGYGLEGVQTYAAVQHGPDGAKFLDPFFIRHLNEVKDRDVIDIGSGAGPWSIVAAKKGARNVVAVDYQMGMMQQAKAAFAETGLTAGFHDEQIHMAQADGASLPVGDNRFSLALSINVGCNLPNTTQMPEGINRHGINDPERHVGFGPHFAEMARVLAPGGRAVVTAPTSFEEIFTNGQRPKEEVIESIHAALDAIGDSQDNAVIKTNLGKLDDVYRATFARKENKWVLITNESDLQSGEEIWRKLPGLVVPNFYHNEDEYKAAAEANGLKVSEVTHAYFTSEQERLAYNSNVPEDQQLGQEYVGRSPFVVLDLEKPNASANT